MNARQPLERRANALIREMLNEWAEWHRPRDGLSFPSQSSFVQERVQSSRVEGLSHIQLPDDILKLDHEINKLAPQFKRIVTLEYLDRRPQKTKAADLNMPRQVFSARLMWIHEQLSFSMWG